MISPVEVGEEKFRNNPNVAAANYLREDLRLIVRDCDAIALMPEWDHSTGARCEVAVAMTLGLEFYDAVTMAKIDPPERVTINGGYEKPAGKADTLDSLAKECFDWSNATFGQATPSSKAIHLHREADELCENPTDREEMAPQVLRDGWGICS